MSTRQQDRPSRVIASRDDLVEWIAAGEKPADKWRIGTEHEKFVFHADTLAPVAYDGAHGINALMLGLMECCGWEAIFEGDTVIALKRSLAEPGANVSLEPGGQFELSGAPLENVHQTHVELDEHVLQLSSAGTELGLKFLGIGFSPTWRLPDTPKMPKQRYKVMTGYMPRVGSRGLDMMYRTTTIQVNLDFSCEADMVEKMRLSLALQPIATALFSSSVFCEGRPSGFKSLRSEVWRHTDPHRTGMLPFVFEDGMGYERYVDYALDVPMYFVYRDGRYIDVAGASFRDFLSGSLSALPGEVPSLEDWSDHLTTLFPEVRLKRFLEMRGADGGRREMVCALSAFWVGLLYDGAARAAAWDLVKDWTDEEREMLRAQVARDGLQTRFRGGLLLDVARDVFELAREGLKKRGRVNGMGEDETVFLAPLEEIVNSGKSVSDRYLEQYAGDWGGDINRVFEAAEF